jgi:hypothetical protein
LGWDAIMAGSRRPLEAAAAAAVRSATLESAAVVFAAVGKVVVVFLLPRVAAPVVTPFVLAVLVAAAASGTMRTAAAASSVTSFVEAVRAVVSSIPLFMPVEEFLTLCCTSRSDTVSRSGTEHGTGSGSGVGSALFFIRVGARPLAAGGAVVLQSALDQLDRVASQLEIGMEVGVHWIL